MVIDHNNKKYRKLKNTSRWNGAYYYSKELVENIIPNVRTTRNWVTINCYDAADHSIVFVHNNLHPEHYDWLKKYKDIVLVVGVPETASKVSHLGKTIYLPLSIDVPYVEQFKTEKTKDVCFVGRPRKFEGKKVIGDPIGGIPREEMLARLAQYRKAYAVGRCALEAKVLGCEILPYDERFPDPALWTVLDNSEAASILQRELDIIDKERR